MCERVARFSDGRSCKDVAIAGSALAVATLTHWMS